MLEEKYAYNLKNIILTNKEFHPFPKWGERDGWSHITDETKKEWITGAEKYLDFTWPTITADKYLYFNRTGKNVPYLMHMYERRSALGILGIAECLEGDGRFIDQIINGIICICEETSWITPFDLSLRDEIIPLPSDRIVDLSCSETGALLAWIYYLLKKPLDEVTPRVCKRIEDEIHTRLVIPYLERDDYWWMGFVDTPRVNNWNPWCNKNMLMCFSILDIEEETRLKGIHKVMRSLDQYMLKYPSDGGCDEGPMYWGAAGGGLYYCLNILYTISNGAIDIYEEPIVQKIGQYIYKVHIHDRYFVNFADGDALVGVSPAIYNYGVAIKDANMIGLGASAKPSKPSVFTWFGIYGYLVGMFSEKDRKQSKVKIPYIRDAWLDYIQVLTAREHEGNKDGLFLAAKGGHNGEAHNHNDIGSFIVYIDGEPLFVDLGTEEYTAKTFSKERFDIWYLQSQYHNCPTIRGVMQKDGKEYGANNVSCNITESLTELTMDIAGAYPHEAGIDSWIRTFKLVRDAKAYVEVIDDYRLTTDTSEIYYTLMTPCEPLILPSGEIKLEYSKDKSAFIYYDDTALLASIEKIPLEESRLKRNWGDMMYRIVIREKTVVCEGMRKITIIY